MGVDIIGRIASVTAIFDSIPVSRPCLSPNTDRYLVTRANTTGTVLLEPVRG